MKEAEFRTWLEARRWNGKPLTSISSRMSKARRFEKAMPALGFAQTDLDVAFDTDGMESVTERLRELCRDAATNGSAPAELVGNTTNAAMRISNVASAVRNYRQFREAEDAVPSTWPALEDLRAIFLDRVPEFERFDRTNTEYQRIERAYKDVMTAQVRAIALSDDGDGAAGRRIYRALIPNDGPLLRWQTDDDFARKFSELAPAFYEVIGRLARDTGPAVDTIMTAVDALAALHGQGAATLTVGEILRIVVTVYGMVHPERAAPFAITKAQALAKALVGDPIFTGSVVQRAQVERWLELLHRIETVMRDEWHWHPRDLVDVQGFAWIALDDRWKIEDEMDDDALLARFAGNQHFDRERARWTTEQTAAFCAIARAAHDAGLDWYHTDHRRTPVRFGRKSQGTTTAYAVQGYLMGGGEPRIEINDKGLDLGIATVPLDAASASDFVERLADQANAIADWFPPKPPRAGRWPDEGNTETAGIVSPIWLVTSRNGEADGVEHFRERGEWHLIEDRGGRTNALVREMQPGDRIVLRDFIPRVVDPPFNPHGQQLTALRIRATGVITEQRDDGLSVGVAWDPLTEPRLWYGYTHNYPIWRLRLDREMAQRLAAFIFDGVPQDYEWFAARWFEAAQANATEAVAPDPTNLILYGPPGTGKTYATAEHAVGLCGEAVPDDRTALMARYAELSDAGRIEFVTFHQSMAYEDFVEGLRPSSVDEDGQPLAAGFRLAPTPGIFRKIARRAELSTGVGANRLSIGDRGVFKMSLGEAANPDDAYLFEDAIRDGHVVLGFNDIDWSDPRFESRDEIMAACRKIDPEAALNANSAVVQMPHIFRNWMKKGDWVVVSKGTKLFRAIGIVTGDYRFAPREGGDYGHQRDVTWLWSDPDGVSVEEIYSRNFSMRTTYELTKTELNIPALERYANSQQDSGAGAPEPFVLVIDEINRANISKVFGELITLLEPDKRLGKANALKVRLPYSGDSFGVPANLHIVGTMNTADRSIALIDKALRRRFTFTEMMPDYDVEGMDADVAGAGVTLADVLRTINDRIEYLLDREHQIGHGWLLGCDTREKLDAAMREKVIPLIAEYFFEDWGRTADVLGGRQDNPFLDKQKLPVPHGLENGEDRYRWSVRRAFAADAYTRLIG